MRPSRNGSPSHPRTRHEKERDTGRGPSILKFGITWAALIAATVSLASAVALAAPEWLADRAHHSDHGVLSRLVGAAAPAGISLEPVELPNDPLLALDIFVNNFVLAFMPLLGGWLAGGATRLRRTRWLLVGLPCLVIGRSVITLAAVGGADLSWLVNASRWWLLELGAIAAALSSGFAMARKPDPQLEMRAAAMRRSVLVIVALLAIGSVVEVFTA